MNWLTNFVRPKIRALVKSKDVPENLWEKCPSCGAMIFHRELEANERVCPHCSHHMRIPAIRRLKMLLDDAQFTRVDVPKTLSDPLRFRDSKRYSDRLRDAQNKTEETDAIIVARGKMGGQPVIMAVFDFSFMGGSMGIAVGEGLVTAAKAAVAASAPLIVVPASGGARMQEGILSLMQMPRSVIAVEMVKEAELPYIVLITDPTTGGVTASFAMLGDIAIAEPGAIIGFAGPRVIEETIRETLPEGFQRSEYLLEHGMIDMVVDRRELRSTMIRLLKLVCERQPPEAIALPATGKSGKVRNKANSAQDPNAARAEDREAAE